MLSERQRSLLKMYGADTYAIALPRDDARELERLGFVKWMPPMWGSQQWAITDAGTAAIQGVHADACQA